MCSRKIENVCCDQFNFFRRIFKFSAQISRTPGDYRAVKFGISRSENVCLIYEHFLVLFQFLWRKRLCCFLLTFLKQWVKNALILFNTHGSIVCFSLWGRVNTVNATHTARFRTVFHLQHHWGYTRVEVTCVDICMFTALIFYVVTFA